MGLDALNLQFVQEACAGELLPHLRDALASGAYGPMESTTPPFSAPAWVTFATGRLPDRHGVYDFWRTTYTPKRKLTPISSREIQGPTLRQLADAAGLRSNVVQVPMTYPPSPINGTMVTDPLMTPNEDVDYTFPAALKDELKSVVRDLQVKPYKSFAQDLDSLADVARHEAHLGEIVRHLLAHHPSDLFLSVTQATDIVQHYFRQYLYPAESNGIDPSKQARYASALRQAFAPIDELASHYLAQIDEGAMVFFVSDHGFGAAAYELQANRVLADLGLLIYADSSGAGIQRTFTRLALHAAKTLDPLRLRRRLHRNVKRRSRSHVDEGLAQPRDWTRTRAFAGTASSEGIYVNLRGREPMGIVAPGAEYEAVRQTIIDGMLALRAPETGAPIVAAARRREEVYASPPDYFPDVILSFDRNPYLFRDSFSAKQWLRPLSALGGYGRHNPQGLFAAFGAPIRAGSVLTGARLVDVAPTLLYALGVPVPRDMDGRILTEAFTDEHLRAHPPEYVDRDASADGSGAVTAYTPGEEEQITRQLRDLGYV
jgi:predicted AlkP superfamily phosphohydrolase/phosphomutase